MYGSSQKGVDSLPFDKKFQGRFVLLHVLFLSSSYETIKKMREELNKKNKMLDICLICKASGERKGLEAFNRLRN